MPNSTTKASSIHGQPQKLRGLWERLHNKAFHEGLLGNVPWACNHETLR